MVVLTEAGRAPFGAWSTSLAIGELASWSCRHLSEEVQQPCRAPGGEQAHVARKLVCRDRRPSRKTKVQRIWSVPYGASWTS